MSPVPIDQVLFSKWSRRDLWLGGALFCCLIIWHLPALTLMPGVNHDEIMLNAAARNWTARGVAALSPLADAGQTYGSAYYWHPPGFFLAMAAAYEVFGFSIQVTRGVSLFAGAMSLPLFFLVVRAFRIERSAALLASALVAGHPLFWWLCRSGRMDLLAIDLGLLAMLVCMRGPREAPVRAASAGLLLGIAALFHVMILSWAPALIMAEALRDRRLDVRCAVILIGLAAAPVFLWMSLALASGDWGAFHEQFVLYQLNQRSAAGPFWRHPLEELLLFWRQFLFLPAVLPILAAGLWMGCTKKWPGRSWATGGCMAVVLLITFVTAKGTGAYPLYWFVWVMLIVAAGIATLPTRVRRWLAGVALVNVATVQLGSAAVGLYQRQARDPARVDQFIATHVAPGSLVVGPEDVWYAVEHAGAQLRIWVTPDPKRHDYVVTYANVPPVAPKGYDLVGELEDIVPKINGHYFSHTAFADRIWISRERHPDQLGALP